MYPDVVASLEEDLQEVSIEIATLKERLSIRAEEVTDLKNQIAVLVEDLEREKDKNTTLINTYREDKLKAIEEREVAKKLIADLREHIGDVHGYHSDVYLRATVFLYGEDK